MRVVVGSKRHQMGSTEYGALHFKPGPSLVWSYPVETRGRRPLESTKHVGALQFQFGVVPVEQ
jgi:hypothetical protein